MSEFLWKRMLWALGNPNPLLVKLKMVNFVYKGVHHYNDAPQKSTDITIIQLQN